MDAESFAHILERYTRYYESKSRESRLQHTLTKTIKPILMPATLLFVGSLLSWLLIAKVSFIVPIPPFIFLISIVIWNEIVSDKIQKERDIQTKISSELY